MAQSELGIAKTGVEVDEEAKGEVATQDESVNTSEEEQTGQEEEDDRGTKTRRSLWHTVAEAVEKS